VPELLPSISTKAVYFNSICLQTTLKFTPPKANGDPITKYKVKINGVVQSETLSSSRVLPLPRNGHTYDIRISPCNRHCGPWSNLSKAEPDAAPTPPTLSNSVTVGNVYNFSWGVPTSNGCPISQMGWSIDASAGPWTFVPLSAGGTSISGNYGDSHTLYLYTVDSCGLSSIGSTTATSALAYTYNNYSPYTAAIPMCRGNANYPSGHDLPGGSFSQTMIVPSGVGTINQVTIQIDPVPTETASLTVLVDGAAVTSVSATTSGNTVFNFGDVAVTPGDTVTLQVSLSDSGDAANGQIVTIYEAGAGGGTFTYSNSCVQDNESGSSSSNTLRATVTGWS
jgi:hypothetical protein